MYDMHGWLHFEQRNMISSIRYTKKTSINHLFNTNRHMYTGYIVTQQRVFQK